MYLNIFKVMLMKKTLVKCEKCKSTGFVEGHPFSFTCPCGGLLDFANPKDKMRK